jgi:hypothetical protein
MVDATTRFIEGITEPGCLRERANGRRNHTKAGLGEEDEQPSKNDTQLRQARGPVRHECDEPEPTTGSSIRHSDPFSR